MLLKSPFYCFFSLIAFLISQVSYGNSISVTSTESGYVVRDNTKEILKFGGDRTLLNYDGNLIIMQKSIDDGLIAVVREPTSGKACNGYGNLYIIWLKTVDSLNEEHIKTLDFCGISDIDATWDNGFVKIKTPEYIIPTYLDDLNLRPGPDKIVPGEELLFRFTW